MAFYIYRPCDVNNPVWISGFYDETKHLFLWFF